MVVEIAHIKKLPQQIYNKEQKVDMGGIKNRVGQGLPLGINDIAGLLKEVATPRLDKNTWQQLKELGSLVQDKKQTKEFEQASKKIATDMNRLANAWSKNKNMPALNNSYFVPDAVKDVDKGIVTRDTLSSMYDLAVHTIDSTSTKKSHKIDNKEEWGGGRDGWSY